MRCESVLNFVFRCFCAPLAGVFILNIMHRDNENTVCQEAQLQLLKQLQQQDTPKHLISNLTDIFVGYNGSEYSDCMTERQSKSNTFMVLLEFLGGLANLNTQRHDS